MNDAAEHYLNQGAQLAQQGSYPQAIQWFRQALLVRPTYVEAHHNLGILLVQIGQSSEAVVAFRQALSLDPTYLKSWFNLGKTLRTLQHWEEADSCFQQVIRLDPGHGEAYYYLGLIASAQHQLDPALAYYNQAILCKPDLAFAHVNRGEVLTRLNRWEEAILAYQNALRFQPNLAEAHCNLGIALWQHPNQERVNQAIQSFRQAIALKPDLVAAYQGLFDICNTLWIDDFSPLRQIAADCLQTSGVQSRILATLMVIVTHHKSALTSVARDHFLALEHQVLNQTGELTAADIRQLYAHLPFFQPYLRDDLHANLRLHRQLGKAYADTVLTEKKWRRESPLAVARSPRPVPLRIGILSNHFHRHPVGWCSVDVISALNQLAPLYLYATGEAVEDNLNHRFRQCSTQFYRSPARVGRFAPAEDLARQMQADQIDVLIELDSLTIPTQIEVLLAQPAPICLSWLGFEAPFVSPNNYVLGDRFTHPPDRESLYCEKILRMPHGFMAVQGFSTADPDPTVWQQIRGADLNPHPDPVVYVSVAPGHKLNAETVRAQVEILQRVPQALLLRKGQGDVQVIQGLFGQACQELGVDPKRIRWMGRLPSEEQHRAIYQAVDVLLDSYPYNGGSHTLEALWAGVPVVTRCGDPFLSRMGYSCLRTLGIEVGIATSWTDYVEWGVELGLKASLRRQIKQQLERSRQAGSLSPLWDPPRFAQDLLALCKNL